ncbi:hypothetical protein V7S43_016509 [Phytophthora oleae]|uniref:Uncharacterized protein n=1 Tax=Phytophthora oleae TaxID=2107226 RepID=A0ABD3EXH8_9STRA
MLTGGYMGEEAIDDGSEHGKDGSGLSNRAGTNQRDEGSAVLKRSSKNEGEKEADESKIAGGDGEESKRHQEAEKSKLDKVGEKTKRDEVANQSKRDDVTVESTR